MDRSSIGVIKISMRGVSFEIPASKWCGRRYFQSSSKIIPTPLSFFLFGVLSKSRTPDSIPSRSWFLMSGKNIIIEIEQRLKGNGYFVLPFHTFACSNASVYHTAKSADADMNGRFVFLLNLTCFEFLSVGNFEQYRVSLYVVKLFRDLKAYLLPHQTSLMPLLFFL